ncbi:MAG: hypothetical protein JO332_14745 [Planctomycetaceae bacterium]|nr:hypothetical protein [Planctomycetaceae bacterium]
MSIAVGLFLALLAQDAPYDPDPQHPWNELHRSLFTFCPSKADLPREYEGDPLFWPLPQEPWTAWSVSKDLVDRLDRFKDSLFQDPLKRAILQHDLWMFLDGLEGLPMGNTTTWAMESEELRNELRRRIVPILRRLALSIDELRALPDNYAQAVKSKRHAASFNAAEPERPFLPADLWEPEGPWVLVGNQSDAALAHEHVKLQRGRSAFFVFVALPGGRAATLEYVNGLKSIRRVARIPDPPAGTRLLLLRRAFILDVKGVPHLSPLTEEIRIRASLAQPQDAPAGFFEFHLNRGDLFKGAAGGLRATGPGEEAFLPFFNLLATARRVVRTSCTTCHGSGAILSTGFRLAGFDPATHERFYDGIPLKASTLEREADLTASRQRNDDSWQLLNRYWPKD